MTASEDAADDVVAQPAFGPVESRFSEVTFNVTTVVKFSTTPVEDAARPVLDRQLVW